MWEREDCYFLKFPMLLETEFLNFLLKHNTLLPGTVELVNLNVKFWKDNYTEACNQNSNLGTDIAVLKQTRQFIKMSHRRSSSTHSK